MSPFYLRLIIGFCGVIGFGVGFTQSYLRSNASPQPIGEPSSTTSSGNVHRDTNVLAAGFEPLAVDPVQALKDASLHVSSIHRRYEIVKVAATLGSDEIRSFLQSLRKEEHEIRELLLQLWTEKNPAAAASYAAGLFPERRNDLRTVFRVWARRDITAALAGSLNLPASSRLSALEELAGSYFSARNTNPILFVQTVMSAAREASDNSLADSYLPRILRQWAMNDTAAALAFAKSLPDAKERENCLTEVLEGWVERDPKEAMKHFGEMTFSDAVTQMVAAESMAERLAEKDAALAAEFAQALPEGLTRARAVGAVATRLLSTDRDAALALVSTIPSADSYGLVYSFYESWVEEDPVAAIQHCSERLAAMERGNQARKDFAGILENNFLTTAMERDPRGIAELLAGQAQSQNSDLLTSLLRRWSYRDSVAAVSWADALPKGVARDYAFAGLAEGRASQSLHETVDWLRNLPRDSTYPAAIQGFASAVFPQDPDGALAWIHTIADPTERLRRLQSAWVKWASSDFNEQTQNKAAAEKWRDSSPDLSEQERRSLVLPSEKQE